MNTMPKVECPNCGERFYVVYPEEDEPTAQSDNHSQEVPTMNARLLSWEQVEPRHPYPAEAGLSEEEIQEHIQRVQAEIEINGERRDFEFYYKPMELSEFWTHVVRGNVSGSRRSKNALWTEDGELYIKNRGVPWDQNKRWTYLSRGELQRRSEIAGLGDVIDLPETEGGLGLTLGVKQQPLVVDGEVQEDILLPLAKALVVFQSEREPVI